LEDEVYDKKEVYITYFTKLVEAWQETDTDKLVEKWAAVDTAWMDINTPFQP